jgi:glutamyl-tRNA reductase
MNLHVVYCNHQTIQLDVRERLAFSSEEQFAHAYRALRERFPRCEIVVLSTCNRVELYTVQEDAETAPTRQQLAQFFAEFHHVPLELFFGEMLEQTGSEAVSHLFQVASSLDSMVLGEPQIVSQVKEAYRRAEENAACGPLTRALFDGALRASNRVRSETRLSEGRVSIASVAVGEFGKSIFDHFADKLVLVIGAGEMAEETLRYLKDEGVRKIVVVNRSLPRAVQLAESWGGTSAPLEQLDHWMGRADVIVSTTGADQPIVDADRLRRARATAERKPVFILDLGAPRDFETAAGGLDDVFLYDIDDLQKTCERNRLARAKEIERALAIIDEETQRFMAEIYHRATGPIVARLREGWHEVSQQELERLFKKLPHLDAQDRDAIERSVERIVNKLLHPPLEALRDEARAGTPQGLVEALKRLFRLGEP